MAITKGRISSDGSVIFGRNSIDNIVESTENPNTYVTSGGKLLANYMDLQSDISSASTDSEKAKAPTTSAVQSYISDIKASVDDVLIGTNDTNVIDVKALHGALTAGQAVDVTSVPDQTITGDYKGTFTTTSTTLGFGSFPKYASGFKYLMIADITVASARNITPSGTWLDGTISSKALTANTSTRVAMLFNAANKGKFTFSGSGTVTVSNLREYEVTACTDESVAYIASLNNPDAFSDYYLVKQDMIQPWTYIIDMGTSPSVTIASGLSYKLNASTGTHTLTVDTCPEGYDGRDAIIRIRLGGNGVVQTVAPLQLGDALVPYAINNCVVKFRDGEAVLLVEDTLAGYVVTVNSGTDSGSLAYGLAATGIPYIAFSTGTDGTPVQLENAVTANEEVNVVGNGYTNTTVTGDITCTNKTVFANIGLQDVTVAGGTLTLGDAFIPSGSTVSVSGGRLVYEKVTGAGSASVIDLGGTHIEANTNVFTSANGCTFTSGSAGQGGACFAWGGFINYTSCTITGNTAGNAGGGVFVRGTTASIVSSIVSGNFANGALGNDVFAANSGTCYLSGSTVGDVMLSSNGALVMTGYNAINTVAKRGTEAGKSGSVTLTSGATLDLTGNSNPTPIYPGGDITFAPGGATVLYSSGAVSGSYMMDNVTLPAGAKLTNTAVVNLEGTGIIVSSGATASASSVTLTSGNATLRMESNARLDLTSCTITSGTGSYGAALYVAAGGTARLSGCTLHDNTGGNAVHVRGGSLAMSGCSVTDSFTVRDAAVVTLAGDNTLRKITSFNGSPTQSNATVTISSGASIALTEQINFGGTVEVLTGGCTVNGNAIPAGTYTSINSNGQPT